MNSPEPLLTDHLSNHQPTNARPCRIGSRSLIRNEKDEILLGQSRLLLESEQLLTWDLPGGWARPGEEPRAACRRTIREAFGVSVDPIDLLLLHWQPPQVGAAEEHTYVWNAPRLPSRTAFQLTDDEVVQALFVPRSQLPAYVPDSVVERIDAARESLGRGRPDYLAGRAA